MKYLSLFSGIGGFELGIQQAYEIAKAESENSANDKSGASQHIRRPLCIGYSEIDKYAIKIYKNNFEKQNYQNIKNHGNITQITAESLPDFDLICGGFPCQSFSIAGKRGGFNDTRGTLFFDIARIIKNKRPQLLLLENVKGLLSHDGGRTFDTIIRTLDELGYDIQWQVLNSKNFGVPQNRERVFIIGHLRGTPRPKVFPIRKVKKETTEIRTKIRDKDCGELKGEKWGDTERRALRVRRLTPIECERLQGFPDGWTEGVSDTQRYKTLGNAVTVNVIREIVKRLL